MEAGSRGVKERVQDEEMGVEGQNMHLEVRLQKEGDWEVAKQNGRTKASSLAGKNCVHLKAEIGGAFNTHLLALGMPQGLCWHVGDGGMSHLSMLVVKSVVHLLRSHVHLALH